MRGYGRDEFHQSVKEYDDYDNNVRYREAEESKEDTKRTKVTVARLEFRQCLKEQQRKKFETDGGSSRDKSYEKKKLPYDKHHRYGTTHQVEHPKTDQGFNETTDVDM